ncbi:MAG: flippase [Actinobacteria bacterium]|nr:flippase [Actinomycetota bacterium]MCL5883345.1 flippase [Actinomycetota bacterium]
MPGFKTVVRNTSYVFGSRLFSRLLYTVFVIYAASRLGPDAFGAFSFVLAIVELLSSIGDMGLTRYGARELIRYPGRKAELGGVILSLEVLTSVAFVAIGVIGVLLLVPASEKQDLLLLGMIPIFLSGFINTAESAFISSQNFFYSSLFNLLDRIVFVALGIAALLAGASVIVVMWCYVAGVVVEAVLRMGFVLKKITSFSFKFPRQQLKEMLIASLPFAIGAAASMIFLRVNIIALGLLEEYSAVGIFNVAYTLFVPFIWVPVTLARTTLPGFTEIYVRDPDAARMNSWQWYRLMAMLGIPGAMAISLMAGPALSHFSSAYAGSSTVLIILIWSLPMMLTTSVDFNVLQVVDKERLAARALVLVAVATAVLNFILIPPFGINGAAFATVGGTAVRQWLFYMAVRKHFLKKHTAVLFVRPIIGGLAMAAVALPLWRYNPWLATVAALMVYPVVIMLIGGVKPAELKALLRS